MLSHHLRNKTSQDIGIGKGKNYALNFPLRDGISDENYKNVFEPVCMMRAESVETQADTHAGYTTSNGDI